VNEYKSKKFYKYCKTHGIHKWLTSSYTTQQSNVAERKDRTIMKMAKSMFKEKKILNNFWCGVVYTTMYLHLNQSRAKAMRNIIPEKAWSGRKTAIK
jgi:hypothetical protein